MLALYCVVIYGMVLCYGMWCCHVSGCVVLCVVLHMIMCCGQCRYDVDCYAMGHVVLHGV